MENVKEYVAKFATFFGNPVEYKGLKIKPILAKDALRFLDAVAVLQIEKNRIPSVEIIQMSYLEFMVNFMITYQEYAEDFLWLIKMTLGLEIDKKRLISKFEENEVYFEQLPNGEYIYYFNGWDIKMTLCHPRGAKIMLKGVELTSREFDDLRRIILYQNIYEFDETPMSEDFRRVVEQYYSIKNRGIHKPDMEDKAVAIMLNTAYTLELLQEVPFCTFEKMFYDGVGKIDYIATKSLEPHLEKGKTIDHWIYKPIRDKYSEIFSDANEFANKFANM